MTHLTVVDIYYLGLLQYAIYNGVKFILKSDLMKLGPLVILGYAIGDSQLQIMPYL